MVVRHGIDAPIRASRATRWLLASGALLVLIGGCGAPPGGDIVVFLDGAGWYASSGLIEHGLRQAGYQDRFETFGWSAFLGPAHDHLVTARDKSVAQRLADRLSKLRETDPSAQINVMSLSAGSGVVLSGLEMLPAGVSVDNVVLLSPSVSEKHNLTKAMTHVKRNLYATCSRQDALLHSIAVTADGKPDRPAGIAGFRFPATSRLVTQRAYQRVINLPWKPVYIEWNWDGGHTSVTHSRFIAAVIAPRILTSEPYPLDRPIKPLALLSEGTK